jgi:lambda family phage tail tape measure protein
MANMIARLGVVLGLDTAEFNKGLEAAGKKLEQFSQSAEKYGKIGATALVAASAAALQYADELADVAKANEVAVGTVLKLSNALANNGGKADNAGKMLASFTKFIDDAASGSVQAQKTAVNLGVSLKDLGKLSEEELLNKFVKNLGKLEDSVTRSAKGMEIFGKGAKGVDLVGFADDMAKVNKVTKEQEDAIKAAADLYDVLAQSARDKMLTLAVELGPILKLTIDYINQMKGDGNLLGDIFRTVFQTIAVMGSNVAFVFKGIADEIRHTYENAKILVTQGVDAAIEANKRYDAYRLSQRQNLDFYQAQVMGESVGRSANDPRRTDNKSKTTPGRIVTPAVDAQAEAARKRFNSEAEKTERLMMAAWKAEVGAYTAISESQIKQQLILETQQSLFVLEKLGKDMREEDLQLYKDILNINERRAEKLREINMNDKLSQEAKDILIDRENALADASERYARARNQITKEERQGTFGQGFGQAASRFLKDMPTQLEQGAKAFESIMGSMESAIDRFVRTGKLGFKDLAKSIIQDMIAMQMKAAASSFLSSLFGSMFGARSVYQPAAVMGMPGYADGGSPAVGQVSMVGERGPELFVPRTAGTIIPNHALSSVGGTTNVTNNYINAIDTKSFEQRLLGSPNAIWAANQYANKSLAVNRGRA